MARRYIIYCETHQKNISSQHKHNFIWTVNLHSFLFSRVFKHNGNALSENYDDMFRLLQKPFIKQHKIHEKNYHTPTTKSSIEGDTSQLRYSVQMSVAINQSINQSTKGDTGFKTQQ